MLAVVSRTKISHTLKSSLAWHRRLGSRLAPGCAHCFVTGKTSPGAPATVAFCPTLMPWEPAQLPIWCPRCGLAATVMLADMLHCWCLFSTREDDGMVNVPSAVTKP